MPAHHAYSRKTPTTKSAPSISTESRADGIPEALKNFSLLPDDALVRQPVLEALFACSASTIWRRVRKQLLPQPRRMGNITAWRVGDLRAVLSKGAE